MDAQGQAENFGFPGYTAFLPRPMQSSRGRGKRLQKQKSAVTTTTGMQLFELLATVAEQLWQDTEKGGASLKPKKNSNNKRVSTSTMQTENPTDNKTQLLEDKDGLKSCGRIELMDKKASEGAAITLSSIHKDDFPSSLVQSIHKTPSIFKVKDEHVADDEPLENTFQGDAEDVASSKIEGNEDTYRCIGKFNERRIATKQEGMLKNGFSAPFLWEERPILKLGHASEEMQEAKKIENPCSFRGETEIASLIFQDEHSIDHDDRPPLLSSCSSEDAPICLENKQCELNISPKREAFNNKSLSCYLKVRDKNNNNDDDNSLESTCPPKVPKHTIPQTFQVCKVVNPPKQNRARRMKRERSKDGHNGSTNRQGKSGTKRKKLEASSFTVHDLHLDMNNINTVEFTGKSTSSASSPTSATSPTLKNSNIKTEESNVHLRIKSFAIPEFSVDLTEEATVANLKKAVMEAAMKLLGGGFCVRVLLQDKKLPDESASLSQIGISSCDGNLDSLAFMLEPLPPQSSSATPEDPSLHASTQPASRYATFPLGGEVALKACPNIVSTAAELGTTYSKAIGVQDGLGLNQNELNMNQLSHGPLVPESGACILHPSVIDGVEGLAIIPLQQKKPMHMGKRRMRRPFTVAEVEALVEAVEKLGTGRWREVKIQAFQHGTHRTYVDLKDKWKTLVHTARIAPHQRRGEQVPQELLDRVIEAHTFWSNDTNTIHQTSHQTELVLHATTNASCEVPISSAL